MTSTLCITLRFLDPVPQFHGRGDDGDPEWPPSPMRMFQSMVAASATRWREKLFEDYARPALRWLESASPAIVSPQVTSKSFGFRMYVPNNSGDLMTSAWARGDTETTMAKFRVEKDVRPTHLHGDAVHFLFPLSDGKCPHFDVLQAGARSITHLGWGIDMVAGDARIVTQDEADKLEGERWAPAGGSGGTPLRVPIAGTLDDLIRKHNDFLGRLSRDGFKPVPPLTKFDVVHYRRSTDPSPRPYAAFMLLQPDAEGKRSFNTQSRTKDVSGMLRHRVAEVAKATELFNDDEIREMIHGHEREPNLPLRGDAADRRYQFLPLPTINSKLNRVESIRRVLVVGPPREERRIAQLQRRLAGELLEHNGESRAMLNVLERSDWVLGRYVKPSSMWTSVTPVVLPGHHKGDLAAAERMLWTAFEHAKLPRPAELAWRPVGFRAGVEMASRYLRPTNMHGSMFHVRVRFPERLSGPLAVGAGRYRGFGVLASDED